MQERVLLVFPASCADKPLVGQLVRKHDLEINILRASINHSVEGRMLLSLTGRQNAIAEGLSFLRSQGVGVHVADEQIVVDEEQCVHCGACTGICMIGALTIGSEDWKLSYDSSLCVGCMSCVAACPLKAITALYDGIV
jgi:ferredoxin